MFTTIVIFFTMVISILGCGWLGKPLARALVAGGHQVMGSSRSAATRAELRESGVSPYAIDLTPTLSGPEIAAFIQTELLILTVPPGRGRDRVVDFYSKAVQEIRQAASAGTVRHVLYTSSTGVYGAAQGRVTEATPTAPVRDSSRAVLAAEEILRKADAFDTTVLRLAGLAGPDRPPGRWLAGKRDLRNGDAPVNLVHQVDVITACVAVIERAAWGKTYNVCAAEHPTRAEFYPRAATALGLEPPTFQTGGAKAKWIDGSQIKQDLGISFRYDDPGNFPSLS